METHEKPCPICEEYREKLRGLIYAYGDTKEDRYFEPTKQVLDEVAEEHKRHGIRLGRPAGD